MSGWSIPINSKKHFLISTLRDVYQKLSCCYCPQVVVHSSGLHIHPSSWSRISSMTVTSVCMGLQAREGTVISFSYFSHFLLFHFEIAVSFQITHHYTLVCLIIFSPVSRFSLFFVKPVGKCFLQLKCSSLLLYQGWWKRLVMWRSNNRYREMSDV